MWRNWQWEFHDLAATDGFGRQNTLLMSWAAETRQFCENNRMVKKKSSTEQCIWARDCRTKKKREKK